MSKVDLATSAIGTLYKYGNEIYRVISPAVKRKLREMGGKPVSKLQADKINKTPSTITNVKQLGPKIRTAAGVKPFRPLGSTGTTSSQRSALSDMGGQTVKLSKPTGGKGRATLKPKTPSLKSQKPSVKAERPSMKPKSKVVKPRTSTAKPLPSRSSTPIGGSASRSKIATQPPKKSTKPMTPGRAAKIGGTTAVITGAALLGNKGQKKSKAGTGTVTGPKSRPSRNAPNYGMPKAKTEGKDPRGNQIKSTPGSVKARTMKDKISNVFGVKGKSATGSTRSDYLIGWTDGKGGKGPNYEKLKGMTKSQKQKLVDKARKDKKSTLILKRGGSPTLEKMPMPKTKPKSKKNPPSKYKGFSKLPESVQKRINPNLASKYKGGGSVGSGKVARQVKGWGAARKPKK